MTSRLMFILSLIFLLTALLYHPNLSGAGEVALAQQCCPCPVAPLDPITDPAAQSFENGNMIDTANLVQNMQTALTCFQNAVNAAGGNFVLNSAYRPPAYQTHLREIWDKRRALQRVRGQRRRAACAQVAQQVNNEFARHTLLPTQRPAGPNGPHTQGLAIDVGINNMGLAVQTILNLANGCQLHRPFPVADPVHFQHN